jgi:hypothetical protein
LKTQLSTWNLNFEDGISPVEETRHKSSLEVTANLPFLNDLWHHSVAVIID